MVHFYSVLLLLMLLSRFACMFIINSTACRPLTSSRSYYHNELHFDYLFDESISFDSISLDAASLVRRFCLHLSGSMLRLLLFLLLVRTWKFLSKCIRNGVQWNRATVWTWAYFLGNCCKLLLWLHSTVLFGQFKYSNRIFSSFPGNFPL